MAVDLIEKIKKLGALDDELLHTANGQHYVTAAKLVDEIAECVEEQGGRVAIVDLPSLVGVDFTHCRAQSAELVKVGIISKFASSRASSAFARILIIAPLIVRRRLPSVRKL